MAAFTVLPHLNARKLTVHQLIAFCAVVEFGSISIGAKKVHMSQPAVSQMVRGLEEVVGTPLLIRKSDGVQPTAEGLILYSHVLKVLGLLDRAIEEIRGQDSVSEAKLSVISSVEGSDGRLAAVVRAIRKRMPGLAVSVRSASTREVYAALGDGDAHIGLVINDAPHDWHSVHWYQDDIVVVAAPDHPLAQRVAMDVHVDLDLVLRYPLVWLSRESQVRALVLNSMHAVGRQPDITYECSTVEPIKHAVEANMGLSFLPRQAVADAFATHRLSEIPVQHFALTFDVYAVAARMHRSTSATALFLNAAAG